jgi:hypothetical protein
VEELGECGSVPFREEKDYLAALFLIACGCGLGYRFGYALAAAAGIALIAGVNLNHRLLVSVSNRGLLRLIPVAHGEPMLRAASLAQNLALWGILFCLAVITGDILLRAWWKVSFSIAGRRWHYPHETRKGFDDKTPLSGTIPTGSARRPSRVTRSNKRQRG